MLYAVLLFAQEKGAEGGNFLTNNPLLPMIVIMGLFFFLIVLPSQRREKRQREELFSKLKKNDTVVTSAGIIGVISTLNPEGDEVTLKVEEGRIKVLKSSIVRKLNETKEGAG